MRRRLFKGGRGFTLLELLIVMAMLAVVMTAVYSLYITHQRSAVVSEDVADVQQNLRIAMDTITRDIRMAGYLITPSLNYDDPPGPSYIAPYPVNQATNAGGVLQPLPTPDNIASDVLTLNIASPAHAYATISQQNPANAAAFNVLLPEDADRFASMAGANVRIVRPIGPYKREPQIAFYKVASTDPTVPSITLNNPTPPAIYQFDDIIIASDVPFPNTVTYCLGPTPACGPGVGTCPTGQLCLMRIVNGTANVVANNIAGLQFQYIFEKLSTPQDTVSAANSGLDDEYKKIRAVKVMLIGSTSDTAALTGGTAKVRRMESIVQLRNRFKYEVHD